MSKRKGVSAEEKRTRMMQLFYEKKEFFQLKELEKLAPKEKGIIANSVKEVVQSLVDDGSIDTDKIGGSIYFWAFPSKSLKAKKRKLHDLESDYESATKKLKRTEHAIAELSGNKDAIDNVKRTLIEVEAMQTELFKLEDELKVQRDNDPELLENCIKDTQAVKDACNRWTDNVFAIKSWCNKKFFIEDKDMNRQFGIGDDFDYVE